MAQFDWIEHIAMNAIFHHSEVVCNLKRGA
jgi:hypothetical protein